MATIRTGTLAHTRRAVPVRTAVPVPSPTPIATPLRRWTVTDRNRADVLQVVMLLLLLNQLLLLTLPTTAAAAANRGRVGRGRRLVVLAGG